MILHGDCLQKLKELEDNSVDAVITDPPYGLSFMGKKWDYDVPSVEIWSECLRVLKPGGYLLAFAGTRTQHRMAVRIEDAGLEIRDMIMYVYGSGFPKSLNLHKALIKKCTCGNMEAYERAKQNTEPQVRPMSNSNISETISNQPPKREVLQSELSEQDLQIQQSKPTENLWGEKSLLERGDNNEKTERELQGSNLPEMPERVSTNGKKRRVHNATQISDGSTLEQTIDEDRSGASHRPQPKQQQDREPCAFCKQYGTQETRRFFEETEGFGTALKPACEPITVARKPISEKTIIDNFLKWGVGGINIDGSRVATNWKEERPESWFNSGKSKSGNPTFDGNLKSLTDSTVGERLNDAGRFPANFIHDGSEEVLELFPNTVSKWGKSSGVDVKAENCSNMQIGLDGEGIADRTNKFTGDSGSASRFFYCAKSSKSERNMGLDVVEDVNKRPQGEAFGDGSAITEHSERKGNFHPTVKPIKLMEYLVNLVSKQGHTVLDPFMGSGTTGMACKKLGRNFIGIEREEEYVKIAEARINAV